MVTTIAPVSERRRAPLVETCLYQGGFIPFAAPVSRHHYFNTLISWIQARRSLRRCAIEAHLAATTQRSDENRARGPESMPELRGLFAAFAHCRSWIYTVSGACLLDSLTTHDFLSRYGIASWMVVGVKTCPFAAHAWVQVNGCVINDKADVVRGYTPIYASGSNAPALKG